MNTAAYDKNRAAPVPPMGWNSWDCFAATVTEQQLLENARYMRDKLAACGWEYVVCDIQWYEPLAGTGEGEYRSFARLEMDEYSRLVPAENRFPSSRGGRGFGPLAREIHSMGLKFGIHIMRGIPRQAVHGHGALLGTAARAHEIANPFSICGWNSDMYGIDAAKPGAREYYDSLFRLYAQWGVDYVKVDDICNTNLYQNKPYSARAEIELIAGAIARCGRPMVLSLSPGPAVLEEAWHLKQNANLWRMTDDFWDDWRLLKDMFRRCELWQAHVGEGCWPDCDMLPLGSIGAGFRRERTSNFTPDEQRSMMTLWCIFRSPLMMGGDMRKNDDRTEALLTNPEVLAVNRKGFGPRQLARDEKEALWLSHNADGTVNLAGFNLSDDERAVRLPLAKLGLAGGPARDLWQRRSLGPAPEKVLLPPHGCFLWRAGPGKKPVLV